MDPLVPNTPIKRFDHVVKLYGDKYPNEVLDTFMILADTVGIERPGREFRFAREYGFLDPHTTHREASRLLIAAQDELRSDPRMQRRRDSDPLWQWVVRQLIRARKENAYPWAVEGLKGKGSALAQWQQAERIDLGRWSLEDALEALETFEVEHKGVPQGFVVYEWPDGWTVQQLVSADPDPDVAENEVNALLEAEGDIMQHCVGEYTNTVLAGDTEIYSLRDPQRGPHATIEYSPTTKRFVQVMGKQNAEPKPEYLDRVQAWSERGSLEVRPSTQLAAAEIEDARAYGARLAGDLWVNLDEEDEGLSVVDIPDLDPRTVSDEVVVEELESEVFGTPTPYDVSDRISRLLEEAAVDGAIDWWNEHRERHLKALVAYQDKVVKKIEAMAEAGELQSEDDLPDAVRELMDNYEGFHGPADYHAVLAAVEEDPNICDLLEDDE